MSITTATKTAQPSALDLKQGVAYATAATADASEKAINAAKDFAAFNQASMKAFTQAGQILTAGTQDLFRQMAASSQSAFRRDHVCLPGAREREVRQGGA